MGDELRGLEEAKSNALAAFAAIAALIDLAGEPETVKHDLAINSLRGEAVRHLSTALDILGRAKGGGG
jgi:hypothetical protein